MEDCLDKCRDGFLDKFFTKCRRKARGNFQRNTRVSKGRLGIFPHRIYRGNLEKTFAVISEESFRSTFLCFLRKSSNESLKRIKKSRNPWRSFFRIIIEKVNECILGRIFAETFKGIHAVISEGVL